MSGEGSGRRSGSMQDLTRLVGEAVRPLGLVVEGVHVTPAGKRRQVRVLLDRDLQELLEAGDAETTVAPLTLDEVAEATRAVDDLLESSDAMGSAPYVLEVSSPGVERPLTEPRHFRRNVGRLVAVTRVDGSSVTGRLQSADVDGVRLEVAATKRTPARTEQLRYADLTRGQVQVEFSRGDQGEDA
ncbi:MAG TPA: ribosome maturation factor RimP [Segeticoccus sp.]|uniref:ribosome maturation factor RimP n=1 Tax=Segeticoccus sp. TaxID=2706531 RepID=UPI002D80C1F8|nr:ribosome maturation factor RimP [Segeticoccus sp.]HET8598832.1 ribosome maturation factor RimP [Segeticoccus sp.]